MNGLRPFFQKVQSGTNRVKNNAYKTCSFAPRVGIWYHCDKLNGVADLW